MTNFFKNKIRNKINKQNDYLLKAEERLTTITKNISNNTQSDRIETLLRLILLDTSCILYNIRENE